MWLLRRQFECPNQQQEVFKLPDAIQTQANEQYERDVARFAGEKPIAVCLPSSAVMSRSGVLQKHLLACEALLRLGWL